MGVPAKSSILKGFSTINHPFWGSPYSRKPPYPQGGLRVNLVIIRRPGLRKLLQRFITDVKQLPCCGNSDTNAWLTGAK